MAIERDPFGRRKDTEKRDRIGEIEAMVKRLATRNYHAIMRLRKQTMIVLSILTLGLLALGGLSVHLEAQSSSNSSAARTASQKAATTARTAQLLAMAIQNSRLSQCRDQNHHHDSTIATLNREIAQLPAVQRQQAEQNKRFTIALIDDLSPKRNCAALVESVPRPGAGRAPSHTDASTSHGTYAVR